MKNDCTKEVLAVLQANNKIETGEECWSKTKPERYLFQGFNSEKLPTSP